MGNSKLVADSGGGYYINMCYRYCTNLTLASI